MEHPYHCQICKSPAPQAFAATVLQKYQIAYYCCQTCGLLQSEKPYWLEEAYRSAVVSSDTGLVARNLLCARTLSALLYFSFDPAGIYLDVAGGYGLLTRLMRDYGFEFLWSDDYCANVLAPGFELSSDIKSFEAITAFEVMEHLYDPVAFVANWFERAKTRSIIFTTELYSGAPPPLDWWYYGFENGQHISFFQRRTLEHMARELGTRLVSHGAWHMLTDRAVSPVAFRLMTSKAGKILSVYVKQRLRSKTFSDSQLILSRADTLPNRNTDEAEGNQQGN